MDLLSLVLTLRPAEKALLPPRLGRASQAILLARLAEIDAALAEALHESQGPKPFTCSDLMGSRENRAVLPDLPYTLRYTALAAPVSGALAAAFAVGDILTFEGVDFRVEALESGATDPEPEAEDVNPWGGREEYQTLAARHLLPSGPRPRNRWAFLFGAPTAFQSQGLTQPLPLPTLVFGSLVQRWNAFAPVALPEPEVRRFAEEEVVVSRFTLHSAPGWERGRALRIGAIGKITYRALNRDRYWLAVLGLLAEFALFSGVGTMTTAGMGQVRQI